MAKSMNVNVRKKNKADKPTDLRSEPMLRKTKPLSTKPRHYCSSNSQEQERDDHPGKEVNANCILLHSWVRSVGSGNTRVGDEQSRE